MLCAVESGKDIIMEQKIIMEKSLHPQTLFHISAGPGNLVEIILFASIILSGAEAMNFSKKR